MKCSGFGDEDVAPDNLLYSMLLPIVLSSTKKEVWLKCMPLISLLIVIPYYLL